MLRFLGPLGAHMARDRILLIATLALSLAVVAPLCVTHFLPLTDLHYHAALAELGKRIWAGDELASHHYAFQARPSPYWLSYLLLMLSSSVVGPVYGSHLVVALSLLLLPLGVMRLLLALGRSPRLGLWAYAVVWDFGVAMGFVAFTLAMGFSFFFIARVIEGVKQPASKPRQLALTSLVGLLLPMTHALPSAMAALLVALLTLVELPRFRRSAWFMSWAFLPVLGLLPWVLSSPSDGNQPMPETLDEILYFAPAGERIERFLLHSVSFVRGSLASQIQGMTVWVLLVLPLVYLGLRPLREACTSPADDRRAAVLYFGAWAIYLLLPASLYWPFHQIIIYERFGSFVLMAGLLLPNAPLRGQRAGLLVPGVAAALASTWLTYSFCRSYDEQTRPFQEIIDAIPEGKKVLPVVWSVKTPDSVHDSTFALTAQYNAQRGGYTPHIFATPNLPVRPRAETRPPTPLWKNPRATKVGQHAVHYDYVIVQGREADRFRAGRFHRTARGGRVHLRVEHEAGEWRLYSVQRGAISTAPEG